MTNDSLTIKKYEGDILDDLAISDVVIVQAGTGAGKTTQVPQFLVNAGYNVLVTQPRVVAARTLGDRIASEMGCRLGSLVGVRTSKDRKYGKQTRLLVATDGLAMVRELLGNDSTYNVLVIDEVHEWNLNIEILVAWAKLQIKLSKQNNQAVPFKVVIMSATLDATGLSEFFYDAPVITVPGKKYKVELLPSGATPEDDVVAQLMLGRNVLMFQPGKGEITAAVEEIQRRMPNAVVLQMHGDQTAEEQEPCFKHYDQPKCIVATNVAQTSITVDDIDVVVDTGTEKRVILVRGIPQLKLVPISRSDSKQRMGRAGRVKEGYYIDHCPEVWEKRPEFPVAEIYRVRLDQAMLQLAVAGFDLVELDPFHPPEPAEIKSANQALHDLDCFDSDGVTAIGRQVAKLPLDVHFGRMIVEGIKLNVARDIVTIAALYEEGGITAKCERCKENKERSCHHWRQLCKGEKDSDAMAQLALYNACGNLDKAGMAKRGIKAKAYFNTRSTRKRLLKSLGIDDDPTATPGDRLSILKAVTAGLADRIFLQLGGKLQRPGDDTRELAYDTVVQNASWLVGVPKDNTRKDGSVDKRVVMASRFNPKWLIEVAPRILERRDRLSVRYDAERDEVVSTTQFLFGGKLLDTLEVVDPHHPEAAQLRPQPAISVPAEEPESPIETIRALLAR